jgi:mannose-6-phosphate isomerase-like protein (cupin superfamily)
MTKLSHGDYIFIRAETAHQILNNGDDDLLIFEMQFSPENICSEDDIERLHDPHNRQ